MKFIKEGDKAKAICSSCGLTTTTYLLRNLDFSDKSGVVKDVLSGVCDTCNQVVSIPAQSTAKIKSEYIKTRKPLEVRVPAHYIDILIFACQRIDENLDDTFFKSLITFYIHLISKKSINTIDFNDLLNSEIAKAKSSKRLSFKLSEKTENEIVDITNSFGLKNKSELIKAIILKINEDIVQSKKPKHFNQLKSLATAFC